MIASARLRRMIDRLEEAMVLVGENGDTFTAHDHIQWVVEELKRERKANIDEESE